MALSCAGTKPSCRFETNEFSNLTPRHCADSLRMREDFPYLQRIHESDQLWKAPLYVYYRGAKLTLLDTIPQTYDIVRRNARVSKYPWLLSWETSLSKDGFRIYLRETARILVYLAERDGDLLHAFDFGKLKKGTILYVDPEIALQPGDIPREYSFNIVCNRRLFAKIPFSLVRNP